MPNAQKLQSHEPPRHTVEHEIQDTQSVETNEAPPVKRLDGEVTRQGDVAFAAGAYCDVWVGRWEKRSGERGSGEAGGEKVEVEKVSLSLVTSIPLIRRSVGGLKSTSNNHVTRAGAYGSAFCELTLCCLLMLHSPITRDSNLNYHAGQNYAT